MVPRAAGLPVPPKVVKLRLLSGCLILTFLLEEVKRVTCMY